MLILDGGNDIGRSEAPPAHVAQEIKQLEEQVMHIRQQVGRRENTVVAIKTEAAHALQQFTRKMEEQSQILSNLSARLQPAQTWATSVPPKPHAQGRQGVPLRPNGTQHNVMALGLDPNDLEEAARLGLNESDLEQLMQELASQEFEHLESMLEQIHTKGGNKQDAIDRWVKEEADKWVRGQVQGPPTQQRTYYPRPYDSEEVRSAPETGLEEGVTEAADMWSKTRVEGSGLANGMAPSAPRSTKSKEDEMAANLYLKARRELTKLRQELSRVKTEAARKADPPEKSLRLADGGHEELIEAEVAKRARALAEHDSRARQEEAAKVRNKPAAVAPGGTSLESFVTACRLMRTG
jgi:hypothetical protein